MKRTVHSLTLAALFWVAGITQVAAQRHVDVGLYRTGSDLEVRVRPSEDFQGIVSSIVFTLRWERSADAQPVYVAQKSAPATYIPIAPTTEVITEGNYNYQVFAGFGFDLNSSVGEGWLAGQEYAIARIPVSGTADFALVNDDWTAVLEHNADYFISLNGEESTGIIYKSGLDGNSTTGGVTVMPNPNQGQFSFSLDIAQGTDLGVELHNALGQVVFQDSRSGFEGIYRHDMDVRGMGAGVYQLRITRNGHADHHTIIVTQ
jgi:hypothetical protein